MPVSLFLLLWFTLGAFLKCPVVPDCLLSFKSEALWHTEGPNACRMYLLGCELHGLGIGQGLKSLVEVSVSREGTL